METTTPTIASDLRLAVGRLARKVRLSETSGLTPSQLSALVTIDQIGRARLCDVATAEGVSAPTATAHRRCHRKAGTSGAGPMMPTTAGRRGGRHPRRRAALRRIRTNRTAFLQQRLERLGEHDLAALRAALPVLAALAEDEV